jgi:hypothetical protein
LVGGLNATDSGGLLLYVGNGNQVSVSGDIEPLVRMSLSTYVCDFGVLDPVGVRTCVYTIALQSNASSGLVTTQQGVTGDFKSGSNIIPGVFDGAVTGGVREYGQRIATSSVNLLVNSSNFPFASSSQDDRVATTSALTMFSTVGPTNVATGTITHRVAVDATTPVGHYTQTITYTTTASF